MSSMDLDNNYEENSKNKNTKIEIAKSCIIEIVKKLKDTESLGVILFNTQAHTLFAIKSMKITNKDDIIEKVEGKLHIHFLEINASGGTNMEAPYAYTLKMLENYIKETESKNNRIIFLTDARAGWREVINKYC